MTTAKSGVLARFPRLLPIRNPCELRGLCRRSYFGPRTCGGSITNVIEVDRVLNPGFPFSPLNVHFFVQPQTQRCLIPFTRGGDDLLGLRQGNANDPFHWPDGLEAVISYEWPERSNHPFSHSYNADRQVGADNMDMRWGMGGGGISRGGLKGAAQRFFKKNGNGDL
jgi:hypothetical protein